MSVAMLLSELEVIQSLEMTFILGYVKNRFLYGENEFKWIVFSVLQP